MAKQIDKFVPSTAFIEKLPEICVNLELISVYDMNCYSVPELLYTLAQKINQTICNMEHNDTALKTHLEDLQAKLEYLLGEGLSAEIAKIFEKMYADGTLQQLVEGAIVDLGKKVDDAVGLFEKHNESMFIPYGNDGVVCVESIDSTSKTTMTITKIKQIQNGKKLIWKTSTPTGGVGNLEKPTKQAERYGAAILVNGGIWDTSMQAPWGVTIEDGKVIREHLTLQNRAAIGVLPDGRLKSYAPNTPAATMLAEGVKDAVTAFFPIVQNGAADNTYEANYGSWNDRHPRQVLGQKANGDYVILTCAGRVDDEPGMTIPDCIRIMLQNNCVYAYNLDGGGSSTTVVRGEIVNKLVDSTGRSERECWSCLYLATKPLEEQDTKDYDIKQANILAEKARYLANKAFHQVNFWFGFLRLRGAEGSTVQGIESWDGENKNAKLVLSKDKIAYYMYNTHDNKEGTAWEARPDGSMYQRGVKVGHVPSKTPNPPNKNFDTIEDSGWYWVNTTCTGAFPYDQSRAFSLQHIQIDNNNKMQIAFPYSNPNQTEKIKVRRTTSSGTWDSWTER